MTYLYETSPHPARLVLTTPGQPSLTLPVDPALYAVLRQFALAHEGVFLVWAQMALREAAWKMEDAWTDMPPARVEEPLADAELAPTEDEDFPF